MWEWERELDEGTPQSASSSFSPCADQDDLRIAEGKSAAGVDKSINSKQQQQEN